ncbi:EthD family reductase [Anaeromyxobacter oryzae]|uniref:EthD domain-containing protein n=1 Tax=Anaeromyxobacter oryzae TaxID=2918170 RepID=A0ABN6MXL3_9BACT|nr:EthD family reductase [Anaeromyxobacter oryzae]BDG05712.1 hypothetical protein AMOR_47080 [Anaeromyxobacter oryzae]
MSAHLLIMYPHPKNAAAFDRVYREEHLPYAGPRLGGATGVVSQRVVSADGKRAPYYAISDVTFPSLDALLECASSPGAAEALQHASSISTGGPPTIVMVSDDLAG